MFSHMKTAPSLNGLSIALALFVYTTCSYVIPMVIVTRQYRVDKVFVHVPSYQLSYSGFRDNISHYAGHFIKVITGFGAD